MKSPVLSDDSEDEEMKKKMVQETANSTGRCRSLRARKKWNYAKMFESNSEDSDDSDQQDLRPRRQRRKTEVAITEDAINHRNLRRHPPESLYVENTDSSSEEQDDDSGVNISVSVSSRGRIRRLTAKARASVFN